MGAFEQARHAQSRRPEADVFRVEAGVGRDQSNDIVPLTVGDFTAVGVPAKLGEEDTSPLGVGQKGHWVFQTATGNCSPKREVAIPIVTKEDGSSR